MVSIKRTILAGMLTVAGATAVGVIADGPATASDRASCSVVSYIGHYSHGAFTSTRNVIAQIATDSYAPGYNHTVQHTVSKRWVIRAGIKGDIGLSTQSTAQLGNKWIEQAQATVNTQFHLNLQMSASGEYSSDNKTTVTDVVVNNSGHNATFVFYRGVADKVTAPVRLQVCRNDDGGSAQLGHVYLERVGQLATFSIPSSGAIRCGAGTANLNGVAKAALAMGCAG